MNQILSPLLTLKKQKYLICLIPVGNLGMEYENEIEYE